MAFSGNYEIVAISTSKTTIFNDLDYKADIGQHFHKSEKSARRCDRLEKCILWSRILAYFEGSGF